MTAPPHILVVGGSEGIGLAIAKRAFAAGCNVTLWARDFSKLNEAARAIGADASQPSQSIDVVGVDIADGAAVSAAAQDYLRRNGAPDRLYQCAGFAIAAYADEMAASDVARMFAVNAQGTINVVSAFVPAFKAARGGEIVTTSSVLGYAGFFGWSAYAATKHAIVGYSSCLRHELAPYGVSVQVLCPPATQTPGFTKENETKPDAVRKAEEGGGVVSPDVVARAAWDGCGRGGLYILPTFETKFIYAVSRISPGLAHALVRAPKPQSVP